MPSYDFSMDTYFEYITKALGYESLVASAQHNLVYTKPTNRKLYDKQVGRGTIYVTVVKDKQTRGYSMYVPALTYACQPYNWSDQCFEFSEL